MTDEERIDLGQRLHRLRKSLGLGLGELARRCDVSKGYLSQLERGEATNPSVEAVRKLAAGLDVPVSALLEEKPKRKRTGPLPEGLKELVARKKKLGKPLAEDDITMLTAIQYRGAPPKSADDFSLLYDFIKKIVE